MKTNDDQPTGRWKVTMNRATRKWRLESPSGARVWDGFGTQGAACTMAGAVEHVHRSVSSLAETIGVSHPGGRDVALDLVRGGQPREVHPARLVAKVGGHVGTPIAGPTMLGQFGPEDRSGWDAAPPTFPLSPSAVIPQRYVPDHVRDRRGQPDSVGMAQRNLERVAFIGDQRRKRAEGDLEG